MAILSRPGQESPLAAPYRASPDGSPPATISVPQAVTALRRRPEDAADRTHHRVATLTDVYQLVTQIAGGPEAFDVGTSLPGQAWPGQMWPGSPGPASPAPTGFIYEYRYQSTIPVWS